jgi:hypothetical protein
MTLQTRLSLYASALVVLLIVLGCAYLLVQV